MSSATYTRQQLQNKMLISGFLLPTLEEEEENIFANCIFPLLNSLLRVSLFLLSCVLQGPETSLYAEYSTQLLTYVVAYMVSTCCSQFFYRPTQCVGEAFATTWLSVCLSCWCIVPKQLRQSSCDFQQIVASHSSFPIPNMNPIARPDLIEGVKWEKGRLKRNPASDGLSAIAELLVHAQMLNCFFCYRIYSFWWNKDIYKKTFICRCPYDATTSAVARCLLLFTLDIPSASALTLEAQFERTLGRVTRLTDPIPAVPVPYSNPLSFELRVKS